MNTFVEVIKELVKLPKIRWIHLSNAAIETLRDDDYFVLGYTYEDANAEMYAHNKEDCRIIEALAPNQSVWIKTGGYIYNKSTHRIGEETYDPVYRLIWMKKSTWENVKDDLMAADFEWRYAAYNKINGEVYDSNMKLLPYNFLKAVALAKK